MFKALYKFFHPRYQTLFLEYKVKFEPRYGHGKPPHALLYRIIDAKRETYAGWLRTILKYKDSLQAIRPTDRETNSNAPAWNNGFLPGLDIAVLYAMLAEWKPKRYVEIGSGNSTKVAFKAKQDHHLDTKIISIDPYPRAEIDQLADEILRAPFETTDPAVLHDLEAGDILFVDNSHRVLPNSDATVFFMEVLPALRKGVIVHIHDIYLPYDYPQFMCDRFYSEQYPLAAFILANPEKYKTLMPNYFVSEDGPLRDVLNDLWDHPNLEGVERHGGSYWLEIG